MTLQLNRSELIKSLRAFAGFRGTTELDLGETIFPTSTLGDLDNAPFHNKAGISSGQSVTAVAAKLSYVTFFLDAGISPIGQRTVIRRLLLCANGPAMMYLVGIASDADMIASGVKAVLANTQIASWDSERLFPAVTRLLSGTSATQVNLNQPMLVLVPTNDVRIVEGPWNLTPGNHLVVNSQGFNVTATVSAYGDEYLVN